MYLSTESASVVNMDPIWGVIGLLVRRVRSDEISRRYIAHSHHSDVPQREEEHHEVGVGGALRELGDEVRQREEEQGGHQVHLQHSGLSV